MSKRKRKNKGSNLIGFFILPIIFAAIGFGIWYFYGGTSEMTTTIVKPPLHIILPT